MYVKKRHLEGKKKMDVRTCLVYCASVRAQTWTCTCIHRHTQVVLFSKFTENNELVHCHGSGCVTYFLLICNICNFICFWRHDFCSSYPRCNFFFLLVFCSSLVCLHTTTENSIRFVHWNTSNERPWCRQVTGGFQWFNTKCKNNTA